MQNPSVWFLKNSGHLIFLSSNWFVWAFMIQYFMTSDLLWKLEAIFLFCKDSQLKIFLFILKLESSSK